MRRFVFFVIVCLAFAFAGPVKAAEPENPVLIPGQQPGAKAQPGYQTKPGAKAQPGNQGQ